MACKRKADDVFETDDADDVFDTADNLQWLFINDTSDEDCFSDEYLDDGEELAAVRNSVKARKGREAIEDVHPEIIDILEKFIHQSSAEAHLRRRDSVMYTNGLTLQNMVDHVYQTIRVRTSRSTVSRLMKPRRRGTHNSKRFKCLIDARVPPKRNYGERFTHEDFHYTCSQVNILNEMAELYNHGTVRMSVDNKNKIDVGIPAVNRRNKIRTIHLSNSAPNYEDHDFPNHDCKLVPAGYMRLKGKVTRSRSLSPPRSRHIRKRRSLSESSEKPYKGKIETVHDDIKREKIYWSRGGQLTVQIYPSRTIQSTNVMHVNFLISYLSKIRNQEPLYNVTAIADNGPDWSVKSVITFISLGYLWETMKLDTLIVQSYAPHHSRFNPIERMWSPLTNWLTTVILPDEIDGVKPKETDKDGWDRILDIAVELCSKFWNGKKYDGNTIVTELFKTSDPLVPSIIQTHEFIKGFVYASKKQINNDPRMLALREKYKMFVNHCNRKKYQLEFIRCENNLCTHCTKLPTRDDNEFLKAIREFGGSVPTPKFSHNGHYKTFLELLRLSKLGIVENSKELETCPYGCSYTFFSKTDKKRHYTLMDHPSKQCSSAK